MPKATIAARFIGGPYDGQTEMLPAGEDKLIGAYPVLHTVQRAVPPEFSLAPPDPDEPRKPPLDLCYRREHRGGAWMYVLYGTDEARLPEKTDPMLEAFVAHVRREWPNRQILTGREVVPAEFRGDAGFDEHFESRMLGRLHQKAGDQGGMLVLVNGPQWESRPDDGFMVRCTVAGTLIPQFGGKRVPGSAQTSFEEQRDVPPVDGAVPSVVAIWGPRSQLRWFGRFRSQLGWQSGFDGGQFYIESELHRGWCCSSCISDIEAGYDESDPDRCCCRAERRRTGE